MRMMNVSAFVRKALNDQGGQVLPWVTLMMVSLLGMAGLTIDVGHAYVVKSQLQSSSNAAVLSAAENVYNNGATDNANYLATQYSAGKSDMNVSAGLGTVTPTVTTPCLNMLMPSGTGCVNSASGNAVSPSAPNAVRIVQTASVPTYFMRIFGVNSLTVSAGATASFGAAQPWNVAIILDATPSMQSSDPLCTTTGANTSEQCALSGIQTMLGGIPPCEAGLTTPCNAAQANAVFRVSMFTFPNITTSTISSDWTGSGSPTETGYTLPARPAALSTAGYQSVTYTGATSESSTYLVTQHSADTTNIDTNGFTSDYYLASTLSLNPSSKLVKIIGTTPSNGYLKVPATKMNYSNGGVTYFAGAIYAAEAALQAEKVQADGLLGIPTNNAIIFVSDGQANTGYPSYPQATSTASSGGVSVTYKGSSTKNLTGTANTFGTYPDYNDDCQQAIAAAQYAISQGTRFYAVAYGSEANGCVTDNNVVVTGTLNVPITAASQVIPCVVMEDMASPGESSTDPWYFYTDGESIKNGCKDTTHDASNLGSIFGAIRASFVTPRLIPNNAT